MPHPDVVVGGPCAPVVPAVWCAACLFSPAPLLPAWLIVGDSRALVVVVVAVYPDAFNALPYPFAAACVGDGTSYCRICLRLVPDG